MDLNPYSPPQSNVEPATKTRASKQLPYASRPQRLGANIIDTLIGLPVSLAINTWLAPTSQDSVFEQSTAAPTSQLISLGISFLIVIVIHWLFLGTGQTIGKKLVGIQVQSREGRFLSRGALILKRMLPIQLGVSVVAIAISPLLGGLIGLADVLCIFRKNFNTLHDDLAGTEVVKCH